MKNAFARIGQTCAFGLVVAGAMLAGSISPVTVNLPHDVTVGSTTLPSGQYTITSIDMRDGNEYFVVRPEHGAAVTLPAYKIDARDVANKTEVTLQKDGSAWRLDKIFVQGDANAYQFEDQK
jgi:hypothetical protein